ncbi:MAG TPA: hypothetical protein VHP11_12970 [Tepidisphaeraceae bacterium]|nr:hypothetical protein [Tepidisphaeraceae bacterium]
MSESVWMTYADMAQALGITPASAKRLAIRRGWPKRPGNDGQALVSVPKERLQAAEKQAHCVTGDTKGVITSDISGGNTGVITGDARALIAHLETRIAELTANVAALAEKAEKATIRAEVLEAKLEGVAKAKAEADKRAADLAEDRDHWRQQASRSLWQRLMGR